VFWIGFGNRFLDERFDRLVRLGDKLKKAGTMSQNPKERTFQLHRRYFSSQQDSFGRRDASSAEPTLQ
jgi:hypothetical protein